MSVEIFIAVAFEITFLKLMLITSCLEVGGANRESSLDPKSILLSHLHPRLSRVEYQI
jgi:hypothetical protein